MIEFARERSAEVNIYEYKNELPGDEENYVTIGFKICTDWLISADDEIVRRWSSHVARVVEFAQKFWNV